MLYSSNYGCGVDAPDYAPISKTPLDKKDPLVAGILHQLKALIDTDEFSLKTLKKIADVARTSQQLLGHVHTKGLTVDEDGLPRRGGSATNMNDETFGAQTMRGFSDMFGSLTKSKPSDLVDAIVSARKNDMNDIADDLERELRSTLTSAPPPRAGTYHANEEPIIDAHELPPAPAEEAVAE